MSSEEKLKQQAIIQFCESLGQTQVQTMKMLNRSTIKRFLVYKKDISGTVNTGNNNGLWQMWPSLVKI